MSRVMNHCSLFRWDAREQSDGGCGFALAGKARGEYRDELTWRAARQKGEHNLAPEWVLRE